MTTARKAPRPEEDRAAALLRIVGELALELQPELSPSAVHLDAALDRDLALDSLGRVELVLRLEDHFGVSLAEEEVALAETSRDLLGLLDRSTGRLETGTGETAVVDVATLSRREETPATASTLLEVLDWHADAHPERLHVLLYGDGEETLEIHYGDLLRGAQEVAAGLRERGVASGQMVAIMLPTGAEYFFSFYGILLAGAVPVPLYPPVRPSQLEDHLRRQVLILRNCDAAALITVPEAKGLARLVQAQVRSLRGVWTPEELHHGGPSLLRPRIEADDIAFLQYTSGSTGQPKGVVLTHRNLLANLRAMGRSLDVDSSDLFVSWLPLYHDMGLIGAAMGSLTFAFPLVLMSPLQFMARPQRWLWLMHRHRGTISAGPNFAFELCLNKIPEEELEGLDLSAWRMALNGAEPVSSDTLDRFRRRFARFGLRPEAVMAVYGLAESSVGVSFPTLGRMTVVDRIDRQSFLRSGVARPVEDTGEEATGLEATAEDDHSLRFVGCGFPLPGHQIRIADARGNELPERRQGRIQFRGPSSTSGYYRNPEATAKLFSGEWLDSGDLGYMAGGELFITGRAKDLVIRAGRNLVPEELESAVWEVEGVRKGCVAVFGAQGEGEGTERLVVLAETRETDRERLGRIRSGIVAAVNDVAATPPDEVLLAPPGSVLKTSSGKIRRSACRDLYESGKVGAGRPAVWRQMASLVLSSVGPLLRRALTEVRTVLYTFAVWLLLGGVVSALAVALVLVPGARMRRILVRRAARALLALGGVGLRIDGRENFASLGAVPYLVASNHASYVDAVVVAATMPPEVGIVAKAELAANPVSRLLFGRAGVEFVERFDLERGLADSRRLLAELRAGRPLLFFPEGTFTRMPGLLPFRMGTFVTATEAGVPVVPMVIRGTRSMLRAGEWRLHRGPVAVRILAPISPSGDDWAATVELRDRVRRSLLEHLGEPDLVAEREEGLEKLRLQRARALARDTEEESSS